MLRGLIKIEWRRDSAWWRELYKYNTDEGDFAAQDWESTETQILGNLSEYENGNLDYQVRCYDYTNDHTYRFIPANSGYYTTHESNVEIPWNVPRSPNTKLTGDFRNMIKVGIRRVAGKLTLLVDAREFHAQLDEIGCTYTGTKYNDRPAAANVVASSTHLMSTEMLLTRDYRDVEIVDRKKTDTGVTTVVTKMPITATADLASVWSNPPSFDQLKKLCNSANDAARKILEHYQPIDISVEIHKRVVK